MLKSLKKNIFENITHKHSSISDRILVYFSVLIQAIIFLTFLLFFLENQDLSLRSFEQTLSHWDARIYLTLARDWYQTTGDEANFIVFFPLFPLIIKIITFFTSSYFWSGILLNYFLSILSFFFLFKLVLAQLNYRIGDIRKLSLLLAFSPISIYFLAIYTEPLYFFLTILFFYFLQKKLLWHAALVGFFASLTRIMGVTLVIPLIWGYFFEIKHSFAAETLFERIKNKAREIKELVCSNTHNSSNFSLFVLSGQVGLILLGYAVYLLLNFYYFSYGFHYQIIMKEHWNKNITNPFTQFNNLVSAMNLPLQTEHFYEIDKISIVLFPVLVAAYYIRKAAQKESLGIPNSWLIWSLSQWIIITAQSFLLSSTRYLMGIFVVYIVLFELVKNNKIFFMFLLFCFCLLSLKATYAFSLGEFVY